MNEFEAFPKIYRLRQSVIISEKIDGSNGQVALFELQSQVALDEARLDPYCLHVYDGQSDGDSPLALYAGSRTRWVRPVGKDDNYGFAAWVQVNHEELRKLGTGRHFGEWFGAGIQCGYGLQDRRFALFNTARWGDHNPNTPACCAVVPVLAAGDVNVDEAMEDLRVNGSRLVSGYMRPEGIVVYHTQSRTYSKRTFVGDAGKWSSNG